MPAPRLSREIAQETVEAVEAALREGFRPPGMTGAGRGAIAEAAQRQVSAGKVAAVNTFNSRLEAARSAYQIEPDWSLYRPARYQMPMPVSAAPSAAPPIAEAIAPDGPAQRVLVIGDLHQDPRHEHRLDVLTWIARRAAEQRPDRVIQIGDWSTWDSCSTHDRNDTHAARFKPGIKDDLANLQASLQAWRRGIGDFKPKHDIVLGNHENRVERFENQNPETVGTFSLSRDESFLQFGWRTRPYGELFYVGGVAFTHHPTNGAGRAFGGKTGPQRAANETTVSLVSGHTHRMQVHHAPKIGPVDSVAMVEVGCAMPWGEVEHYAAHGMTGWWQGICELTVQAGIIRDIGFVSMLSLRDRYSDAGGDVRAA